jgi:hypothetical protein
MRRARIARSDVQYALSTFFFQLGLPGEIGGRSHPRFRHFHTTKTRSGHPPIALVVARSAFDARIRSQPEAIPGGAEIGAPAEVANVGVGDGVQLLQSVEAGANAAPVPKIGRKWPDDDDLVADIFVDRAALAADRSGDIGDKAVVRLDLEWRHEAKHHRPIRTHEHFSSYLR